ncbi:MAG TPA: hypothetical protein VIH24_02410 [Candidatus Limnocylindria bacterium]
MRPARVFRAVAIAGLLTAALAAPAAAFELNGGCTLELASTDAAGAPLDTASGGPDGGVGGTEQDPFLIDWDGQVSWVGSSGDQVFLNHSWSVSVFNVPTPLMGGAPNDGQATTAEGSTGVSENAPFKFTGLYNVSGQINGDGGTHCDGSGWFKLQGNPLETIPFWVAVGVALIGLVLMISSRGSTVPVAGTAAPPPAAPPPAAPPPPTEPPPTEPPPADLPTEDQP